MTKSKKKTTQKAALETGIPEYTAVTETRISNSDVSILR